MTNIYLAAISRRSTAVLVRVLLDRLGVGQRGEELSHHLGVGVDPLDYAHAAAMPAEVRVEETPGPRSGSCPLKNRAIKSRTSSMPGCAISFPSQRCWLVGEGSATTGLSMAPMPSISTRTR